MTARFLFVSSTAMTVARGEGYHDTMAESLVSPTAKSSPNNNNSFIFKFTYCTFIKSVNCWSSCETPEFGASPQVDPRQHLFQQHTLSTLANTEKIPYSPFHKKTGKDVHSPNRIFVSRLCLFGADCGPHVFCRAVLHAGANKIIVRNRIPVPLLDAGASPSDSLCNSDEDAMNLLRGSGSPRCTHGSC